MGPYPQSAGPNRDRYTGVYWYALGNLQRTDYYRGRNILTAEREMTDSEFESYVEALLTEYHVDLFLSSLG